MIALGVVCGRALSAPFGSHGFVTTHFAMMESIGDIVVQKDGRIVAGGTCTVQFPFTSRFALTRYLPDGSPDLSFGDQGKVLTAVDTQDTLRKVLLQEDGHVLAVGYSFISEDVDGVLLRYRPDGSRDPGFGQGGLVTLNHNFGNQDLLQSAALMKDGRIVVAGSTSVNDRPADLLLARYLPDGSLDPDFGNGGVAVADLEGRSDAGMAVAVLDDGRIVVGGVSSEGDDRDLLFARFLENGALDTGFNGTGLFRVDGFSKSETLRSLAVRPDGRLLGAVEGRGKRSHDILLMSLTAGGAMDTTFGSGGRLVVDFGNTDDSRPSVVALADGTFLLSGRVYQREGAAPSRYRFQVTRHLADGTLDPAFGSAGFAEADINSRGQIPQALAVQPDGAILAGGYTVVLNGTDFALARFRPDGKLDGGTR